MNLKVEIISIEGNIGSGKSTLLNNLRINLDEINGIKIIYLDEPIEDWGMIKDEKGINILEKYYENQEKYSFTFQLNTIISRIKILKYNIEKFKEINKNKNQINKLIIITDRSIYTDNMIFMQMLYDLGKINIIDYQVYKNFFDLYINDYKLDKIIYVNTSPEICFERIKQRNRNCEINGLNLKYLKLCECYHENMIYNIFGNNINEEKILILDGNIYIDKNNKKEILNNWINNIKNFIIN